MPHTSQLLNIQIKKVLLERKRLLAVDRRMLVMLLIMVFLVAIALQNYWILFSAAPGYLSIWLASRRDPDLIDTYLKYRHQADYYEPRQQLLQKRNQRPFGFARKHLC